MAGEKTLFVLLDKLWKKPCSMLIGIEELKREILSLYGYKELTQVSDLLKILTYSKFRKKTLLLARQMEKVEN